MIADKIIWTEGMFLQPQHFQQQDRYVEYLINEKTNTLHNDQWGFSSLSIDTDGLTMGKFSLKQCRGIFPDGTPFNAPNHDSLPPPLDIPENLGPTRVYLALPLKQISLDEISPDKNKKSHRYYIEDYECETNIAGEHQIANLQIGRLALQLILSTEDLNPYSYIAVASIKETKSNKKIILENNLIVPCIDIQAEPQLNQFVCEVQTLLQHRADTLSYRLTDTQQSATAEITDFMLLQVINRFEPLFFHLTHKKIIHPEALYSVLLELMGEISTFTTNKRRPPALPIYQHHNLFDVFAPLCKAVRHSLSMILEQNAIAIHLEQHQLGIWTGNINDKTLLDSANFVLAVYAEAPTETIRSGFPSQVKIAATEQIRQLINRALPGIDLHAMPVAPRQIPYHANFTYFSFNQNHDYWPALKNSHAIAFHISGDFPGLKLELWAIRG